MPLIPCLLGENDEAGVAPGAALRIGADEE
jgi:hypothetical protein